MSVLAMHHARSGRAADGNESIARIVLGAMTRHRRLFLSVTFGFPVFFYFALLAVMVVRFGDLPNYVTAYNWFAGVARIIASTGSVSDMVPIILNEWLLEIGYMNYAFGHGVSEWSLLIIPHKLAMMIMIGALVGLNFALVADQTPAGSPFQQSVRSIRCGLMTSVGALGASLIGITLFWVVCHSSPSWVVSLAILGVEVSTSLALEPVGPLISLAGVAMLAVSALLIVRDGRSAIAPISWPRKQKEPAPC
jgi:hypothetical protein